MNSDIISKSILNEIEDVVYISNPVNYELYYMNAFLKKTLGNPPEASWRRQKCYKVLQGLDEPCPFCTNHLLCYEKFYNWEHYNTLLDTYYFIQDKLVNFEGMEARLEIAKDVTPQKLMEQDLTKKLNQQQVLNSCISLLHTSESPHQSIQKLLGLVAEYHKAERGYIFLIDEKDEEIINNTHEWCAHGVEPMIEQLQNVPKEVVGRWFDIYSEKGEFYIDSINEELDTNSGEFQILDMQGIASLVTAPLYNTDGSFMGFLGVDNPNENIRESAVIRAVSSFVADFLDKNKQLERLYRISYFDSLTDMRNRHSYSLKIEHLIQNAPNTLGVIYVDINGLKAVNDKHGHKEGDAYILKLGKFLNDLYDGCAFRIGGDEFVMMCENKETWCFEAKLAKLQAFIMEDGFPCAAVGYCWRTENCNAIEQIEIADRLMYKNKEQQYNEYEGKHELFRRKYLSDADHHSATAVEE